MSRNSNQPQAKFLFLQESLDDRSARLQEIREGLVWCNGTQASQAHCPEEKNAWPIKRGFFTMQNQRRLYFLTRVWIEQLLVAIVPAEVQWMIR